LIALLTAVAWLPSALLVWLGVRLLDQDQEMVAQRDFERRQAAAPAIVANPARELERPLGQLVARRHVHRAQRRVAAIRVARVERRPVKRGISIARRPPRSCTP
jgi:hypothetical protein